IRTNPRDLGTASPTPFRSRPFLIGDTNPMHPLLAGTELPWRYPIAPCPGGTTYCRLLEIGEIALVLLVLGHGHGLNRLHALGSGQLAQTNRLALADAGIDELVVVADLADILDRLERLLNFRLAVQVVGRVCVVLRL